MAPGSVTHSMDSNQRYERLEPGMSIGVGVVSVIAPRNETYAPPGFYMMFAIASTGAVSTAAWVKLEP